MAVEITQTTVALPSDLLAAADLVVERGGSPSRDELVASALRRELAAREREEIDASFGEMANDETYQREVKQIVNEFSSADWEAWNLSEANP